MIYIGIVTSCVDQVFPELQYFFKSRLHQKAVYALLKEALTPENISSIYMTHLPNLLVKSPHGHFTKDQVKKLRILVQKSVGASDSTLALKVTHTNSQIELLDNQLERVEAEQDGRYHVYSGYRFHAS